MTHTNLNDLSQDLRSIERSFKQQVEPYRSDLWRYCYRLTGNPWDAEDLVQETLLKSLSVLSKVFQPVNPKAYLLKIASNLWIDYRRKQQRLHIKNPDEMEQLSYREQTEFNVMENMDILISFLSPRQFAALMLADIFQFTGKEVGEILGMNESAVHTNLHRARKVMKEKEIDLKCESPSKTFKKVKPNSTINILLEGFRNKDPNLIASILDQNLTTDIVHSGYEIGREETKKNSLNDWKEVVDLQGEIVVEYLELWGRRVVVELEKKQSNDYYLNNVHYFEITGGQVQYWKFYCFSWDLMKKIADNIGANLNADYYYHIY